MIQVVSGMPARPYFESYVSTYVERDVSGCLDVRNLTGFRAFLRLCALNAGSLVNYASLARDADVDARTAKAWLSILESSYVVFTLAPYFSNAGKRLVKSPKLYFYDTGLLCHLLGVETLPQLLLGPHLGPVFENLVVAETLKRHLDEGREPRLFFYRDDAKVEVDLLDFTDANDRAIVEIKAGETYRDRHAAHLGLVGDALGVERDRRYVVARVDSSFDASEARVMCAADWLLRQQTASGLANRPGRGIHGICTQP